MTVVSVTPPVVSGTARAGSTLTTTNGTWTYDLDYLTYSYEWLKCDAAGVFISVVTGQTGSTYLIKSGDVGYTFRSRVTATEHANPTTPPPPTPGTTTAGVSYLRYGNGELPVSHTADYDNVIVSYGGAPAAGASAAQRSIVYMSSITCKTHAGGAYYYGVSKEEVEANGWVLAAQGGGSMYNVQYGGSASPLGDMGLLAYQTRWCQNVVALLNGWGVDGVFIDDVLPTLSGIAGGKTSSKYPTTAAVQGAYASFMSFVTSYLNGAGKYVIVNAGFYDPANSAGSDTGQVELALWNQLDADAYCAETWQVRTDTGRRKLGAQYYNHWDSWQLLPAYTASISKDFCAIVATSSSGDADFSICSMLLETNLGSIIWAPSPYGSYDRSVIWHSFYDTVIALGDPVSDKALNGARWERQYDNGLVWVNPTTATYGIDP